MTDNDERQQRVIPLTDRAPVRVYDDEWPIVAAVKWHNGDQRIESRANRKYWLTVREHQDGRRIVYGRYETSWVDERDCSGGEVVPAGGDTVAAIRRAAEAVSAPEHMARDLISRLPAEEL